jgi:branched-chain amino acid transport system ATP-binding protein
VDTSAPTGRRGEAVVLTITGFGAGYGRMQVLRDVELAVERNQIVALVGPTGAGKTTCCGRCRG